MRSVDTPVEPEAATVPARRGQWPAPRTVLVPAIFLALLFLLWEGMTRTGIWPNYVLPSPATALARIGEGLRDNSIPVAVGQSMKRVAIGYGISMFLGVLLGIAIARFRLVEESVGALVAGLGALPSIVWLPLALLWFGLNDKAIIFVVILGSLLAITQATADGVKNIPPLYFRTARSLGATGSTMYYRVVFPAALPHVITGMKLGWQFAWRSLMAGELIFVTPGLGHLLEVGREFNDVAQVVAVMLVIVVLGLAVDKLLFARLERWVRVRWGLAGMDA